MNAISTQFEDHYYLAVKLVWEKRGCSTNLIQRKLNIGYNNAARIVERMENEGVITPSNQLGRRHVRSKGELIDFLGQEKAFALLAELSKGFKALDPGHDEDLARLALEPHPPC